MKNGLVELALWLWVVFGLFVYVFVLFSTIFAAIDEDWPRATFWVLVIIAMHLHDTPRRIRDAKK